MLLTMENANDIRKCWRWWKMDAYANDDGDSGLGARDVGRLLTVEDAGD